MLRKMLQGLAAALLLAGLTGPVAAGEDKKADEPKKADDKGHDRLWLVDFAKAKEVAARDDLDILVEFTGSDWCPPCIAMYKKVLSQEFFKDTAPKHFVLVKLDNPRDKSKQSDEEIAQYKEMAKRFQVRGVPTVLLMDARGVPYAKLVGYGGQAAEEYTNNLITKTEVRKQRDELLAKAKDAEGVAKAKLLAQALQRIDSELTLTEYRDAVDEIIKLDDKNEAGLKEKFENLTRLSDVNQALNKIQTAAVKDAKGAAGQVDELIAKEKLTGELLQSALLAKGAIQFRGDREAARQSLQQAVEAAPDTEQANRIREIIGRVFKDDAPKEPEKK